MQLSTEGLRLIKSFEGYHRKLADGRCMAYRCPAGVWTIGWGCTEGVREGMVWTVEEAEAGLRRELAKFEAGVLRAVTVEINQHQFDALVSFAYNVGLGALSRSTLLKRVNAGAHDKVAGELAKWNKGGGRVLPGLVARRTREAALYMKPVEAPADPYMPQKVDPQTPVPVKEVSIGVGAGGAGMSLPAPPDLTPVAVWQSFAEQIAALGSWAVSKPLLTGALVVFIAALAVGPRLREIVR